jgi:membrane protease YdiL (CAAX protease family)
MPALFLVPLLLAILSFFSPALQNNIHNWLRERPHRLWILPPLLTATFVLAAILAGAWSLPLALMVLAYTAAPVICVVMAGPGPAPDPSVWDFSAILFLWLPIELAAGAKFVPLPARGFLHSVIYAVAILLGLVLFRCFRAFPEMKYNLPRRPGDLRLALVAFVLTAPVLIVVGIGIGFIPWPHLPAKSVGAMAEAAPLIFFATALPEEILFRSLIQNLLMLRFGAGWRTLLLASVIFGAAHLDNGPQPLPNWRYMIVATIAGVAYGRVFQRASSITASGLLHTMVDWTKHFVF